jgi:hypothetical protein
VRFVSSEVPQSLAAPNAGFSLPVPGSTTLPASFFMNSMTAHPSGGTGLNWWKVCSSWTTFPTSCAAYTTVPFPAVGPDVTGGSYTNGHAYNIPAAVAWTNLPIDPAYQVTYTVTSSSWSNGTETLNISGSFPGTHFLQGPFSVNGLNSACTAGATINAAGEILMTGSGSSSVSYALAANPGVSCTGTLKWPNVRQFDEAVYQLDSTSGSTRVSACDLNQDGVVNSSDYSLAINMALGVSPCTANVVGLNVCNVVVVQRVANAGNGAACLTGP